MTDAIMWDTTFDDPLYLNGFQVGGNVVHDGCRWRVDINYSWNDTQDFNQQSSYSMTRNGPMWLNFQGKGKTITVSGIAAAANRTTAQRAYAKLIQAIPENTVIPIRRSTSAFDQIMFVRLGGPIMLTEDMGDAFRYTMTFVADDPLKYSVDELMDTVGIEVSGLYGFTLPLQLPLKLNYSALTQFVETRRNYAWNGIPQTITTGWNVVSSYTPGWTMTNPVNSGGAVDNIAATAKVIRATAGQAGIDGGINYTLQQASTADSDFWTVGRTYTVSLYVRGSASAVGRPFNFGVGWRTTIGGANNIVASNNFNLVSGWQRLSLTFAVPVGATYGWVQLYRTDNSGLNADWIDVTGLLIEKTNTVGAYFDGSGSFGATWAGSAYTSDSVVMGTTPITVAPLKYQMNLYNGGDTTSYPVSTVNGPLPAGWGIGNLTSGETLQFNFALLDQTEVVTIDHQNQTALLNGNFPIDYTASGDWWGLEPGDNVLQLRSSVYSSVAAWTCTGRQAWR